MSAGVVLMLAVTAAALMWPGRRVEVDADDLACWSVSRFPGPESNGLSLGERARAVLAQDPVEMMRRAWRGRRVGRLRRGALDAAVLALLDAIEPALRAGLTPARALELAAPTDAVRSEAPELAGIVEASVQAAHAGSSVGRVWQRWADDTESRTLHFVAAAWLLSERTGAPLADAVARAAARTRSELSRQRRVSAAVAGPRATVNVLTALPLVGPLFGMASGLDPSEVYLLSPLVLVAVGLGGALLVVGRWWCRRLIAAVLDPS